MPFEGLRFVKTLSLFNTVEQILPVNGFLTQLVRPVQVVKQWFTSRTGRRAMATCVSLVRQLFYLDSTTHTSTARQWFTSRTVCELHIIM